MDELRNLWRREVVDDEDKLNGSTEFNIGPRRSQDLDLRPHGFEDPSAFDNTKRCSLDEFEPHMVYITIIDTIPNTKLNLIAIYLPPK